MPLTADRVKETSSSIGTGSLALDGAASGFRSFQAAFGSGVEFWYAVASAGGAEWEVGVGTLSGAATLQRSQVLASSNASALVAFAAGPKDVFATVPASALNALVAAGATLYASLALSAGAAGRRQALGASRAVRVTAASPGTIRVRFSDASAAIAVDGTDTLVDCAAATPVQLAVPGGLPFIEYLRAGAVDVDFGLGLLR